MLTYSDLVREIIRTNLEVLTIVSPVLLIAGLVGLRRSCVESRQALRAGVRKRSQLR